MSGQVSGVPRKKWTSTIVKGFWIKVSWSFNFLADQSYWFSFDFLVVLHILCKFNLKLMLVGVVASVVDGPVDTWCSTYQSIACLIRVPLGVKWSSMWNETSISWYKALSLFIVGKVWWCTRWLLNGRAVFSSLLLDRTKTWKLFVDLVLFLVSVNLIFFHYVTRSMITDYGKTVTKVLNSVI